MATPVLLSLSKRRELENEDSDHDSPVGPLTLSLLAGLSTCLGASVVFCSQQKKLGPSHMAFSLSLAGSVMITVSVASILPECFQTEDSSLSYLGPSDWQFWARCFAFGVGCGLYVLLSKCAFPEPEDILDLKESPSISTGWRISSGNYKLREATSALLPKTTKYEKDGDTKYGEMEESSSSSPPLSQSPIRSAVQRKTLASSSSKSKLLASVNSGDEDDVDKSGKESEAKRAWRVTMLLFVSLGTKARAIQSIHSFSHFQHVVSGA